MLKVIFIEVTTSVHKYYSHEIVHAPALPVLAKQ